MPNKAFRIFEAEALGETITLLIEPDALTEAQKTHKVIYSESELDLLSGCSDDTLREVHKIKKAFGGWIVECP